MLAIAGVATLAVALFAIPLALVLQRVYLDEELLRLQRDTVAATRGIDVDAARNDPIELPDSSELAVYEPGGRRLAGGGGPAAADAIVREALRDRAPAARSRDGVLVVAVPLVDNERTTGAVRAERSDAAATRATRQAWGLLGAAALGIVALASGAALVLGRRLARPLEQLAATARRLGEGDFAVRSPRSGVTELDDVALALDAAGRRLDELVGRERAFSADASHQLRTPVAALRIELEAMQLRGERSEELSAAVAQVDRLEDTIRTLLAMARDAPRDTGGTPVSRAITDALARWSKAYAAANRELRVTAREPELLVAASASVLREILDVLLDNALRHGDGAVELLARESEGSAVVDVTDSGTTPLDGERLFERSSGQPGGHGIGLALARSLAQAEAGSLTLATAAPPTFRLTLPGAG